MTKQANKEKRLIVAKKLLKQNSVTIRKRNGKTEFVIPAHIAEMLQKGYSFSFDQLRVGGEIPLHELALHMDEQSSLEARASIVSEQARLAKELYEIQYDEWYEKLAHKARVWLKDNVNNGKWPTEGQVKGRMYTKYGKEITEKRNELASLESGYRMLNNVIRSAIIVKGDMLRSMRPLLQGDGTFVSSIDVSVAKKTRRKLIVEKDENGEERKERQEKEKRKKKSKSAKSKGNERKS